VTDSWCAWPVPWLAVTRGAYVSCGCLAVMSLSLSLSVCLSVMSGKWRPERSTSPDTPSRLLSPERRPLSREGLARLGLRDGSTDELVRSFGCTGFVG
jgi:hypothetical protein